MVQQKKVQLSIKLTTMKTKITLLLALILGLNIGFAQNEECLTKLSIMSEYAKAKNYEAAYAPFMELRTECPKYNKAIYKYGEDILEDKIKKSSGTEQTAFINDLMKMWDERGVNFASKTPKGEYDAKKAQLKYDNKAALSLNDEQLYDAFDAAFTGDRKTFKNPKSLYIYFKLMVKLHDAGKKTAQQLFDKYDDVKEKIEEEVADNSSKLNKLIAKEESGTALTTKEGKYKKYYGQVLTAFDKISGSVDTELGERANCSNLVPLYQKDFEANKNNGQWLQRAMNKLYAKGCKEDPMFVKVVKQKNSIEPNADTSYYLYLITGEQKYFDQTLSLETDPIKQAKLYNTIAKEFKNKGNYGKARTFYMKSMQANPANKKPYLQIANMYSKSAKSCGEGNFNKRAVYWLAAQTAEKGGSSKTAARYRALAPTKAEIHAKGNQGQKISIGCWIGKSVTVPSL